MNDGVIVKERSHKQGMDAVSSVKPFVGERELIVIAFEDVEIRMRERNVTCSVVT